MTLLPIITFPNMMLKKHSEAVRDISPQLRVFVRDMFETMYAANGVGLAGVQVARLDRILVVDVGRMRGETHEAHPICLINPEIIHSEGKIVFEEGCLSCPQLQLPMERRAQIVVSGLNEEGQCIQLEANDLLAVALQHEIDHLDGKILADQLSRLKRARYLKDLLV